MIAVPFMESPLWQTVGWLMLHFVWVGGAIGLFAAAGRVLLRTARTERRYAFALGCFAALALSPAFILGFLIANPPRCTSPYEVPLTINPPILEPPRTPSIPAIDPPLSEADGLPSEVVVNQPANTKADGEWRSAVLSGAARYLPWLWLIGAPWSFLLAVSGLIGVERLRRQSSLLHQGDLPDLCGRLARTLGIARSVAVGVCERLAAPILVGVVRPLILLPPAALTGWNAEQLEMILLHELAHVRRWDTVVNLLQRLVEALLFFHPVVWWLSAWLRLEREICCDQIVVAQTGNPHAYAHLLAAFAVPGPSTCNAALAMSENNLVTRIRRILKLEDRTMSVSTKTLGFVFALTIASTIILGLYAQDANPDSAAKGFDDRKPPTKEAVGREKKNFWTDPASGNQYFVGTQDSEEPKKNSSPPASVAIPKLPPGTLRPVPLAGGQQPPAATASDRKPANPAGQFTAEVEAFVQVDLHARVAGIVEKVDVNIGDHVKKGQVLAALAVPELEAEYRQKQAGIEQARAEVEVTRCSAQATQAALATVKLRVREAEAGIQSAKAALAYRKASVERMEKLFNNKAVDQGVLDEARSKLEEAKATLDGAESRGLAARAAVDESMAQLAKTQADQKVAEAKLRVAEADLQRSAVALQYARVCAPFDGVVTRRNVDAGSFAQAPDHGKAEPLFVVARTDMVRVVIHVPDSVAPRLTKGIRATIRFDALAGQEFEAKIARVAGAIDRTNRTLRAEIDLPNTEGKILPGMYGVVSLVFEK